MWGIIFSEHIAPPRKPVMSPRGLTPQQRPDHQEGQLRGTAPAPQYLSGMPAVETRQIKARVFPVITQIHRWSAVMFRLKLSVNFHNRLWKCACGAASHEALRTSSACFSSLSPAVWPCQTLYSHWGGKLKTDQTGLMTTDNYNASYFIQLNGEIS